MMSYIITAALMIGGIGLIVGIFLSFAGKAFFVPVDEREAEITEALPGANCGACGYSGCAALASAIAKGEAPVNACVVGQAPVAKAVGDIMGVTSDASERKVAFVRCIGDCERTEDRYQYTGAKSCLMTSYAPNKGPKSCSFGCTGFGDCVRVCEYDAMHIEKGIAVVDSEHCVDCRKCIKACPKGLIIEVPYGAASRIGCSSIEKGKTVMANCKAGCISCGKCERTCPQKAIAMGSGYPEINYALCNGCGLCKEACPRKCII